MTEMALAAGGLLIAAAAAWIALRARAGPWTASASGCGPRGVAERWRRHELRRQLAQGERDLVEAARRARNRARARTQADTRWETARANLEEQRRLAEDRLRLAETFKTLSAEALEQSGAAFLDRARTALDAQLGRREAAVEGARAASQRGAGPLRGGDARSMEATRQHAYGGLHEQLRSLAAGHVHLQRETGALVAALRTPHVRGRWGELTLRRVVELAGLVEHCDFVEQVTVDGANGRARPDMVVRLPGGREIVVDAKVPLSAYLDAIAAASDEERSAAPTSATPSRCAST